MYDEHLIVDCRFPYEFDGGHIAGAINVNTWDALESHFFDNPRNEKILIIFHCEYSAHRAPRLSLPAQVIFAYTRALHLRNRDRHLNMHRYPKLHYPEIYILQGGYSGFFTRHKERCEPQNYVAMQDERHKATCAREMRNFGKSTKLSRTQSFTYGVTSTNNAAFDVAAPDDDDSMHTEDDTFEGIESRLQPTVPQGVTRGLGNAPKPFIFLARRAVSY